MKTRAFAKINLTLDITGVREDGYHLLDSVMQTVSLCDDIEIKPLEENEVRISSDRKYIPTDAKNTAYKATALFFERSGISGGAEIGIKKRIPGRAGMGGGSADAAAVLTALNVLHGTPLKRRELLDIAAKIGADVPFCMTGGTCRCCGIGEKLTRLKPMPECLIVICKPPVGMSTKKAFAIIDGYQPQKDFSTPEMVRRIENGRAEDIAGALANRFDEILRMRAVREIKKELLMRGALGASMTGSGSAVYGIFTDEKAAGWARGAVSKFGETFLCRPVGDI